MHSTVRSFVSLVALVLMAACASAPRDQSSTDATPASRTVEPPQMNRGSPPPEIRVPTSTSNRATVRVELEVMVDAMGRPDMTTFKATGQGADINRDALRRWMEAASFRPARLDGRPVPALFKTYFQASVRRM